MKIKLLVRRFFDLTHLRGVYDFASRVKGRILLASCMFKIRQRYWRVIKRIRSYPVDRKVRVVFLIDCVAKWKMQSLYDAMVESGLFEPLVVVIAYKDPYYWSNVDVGSELKKMKEFFVRRDCVCEIGFDAEKSQAVAIAKYNPDIVFFQEPLMYAYKGQFVADVNCTALCCYIPYSIEYETNLDIHSLDWFHDIMFLQIAWGKSRSIFLRSLKSWAARASRIEPLGHPAFDQYSLCPRAEDGYVIYAPHFSFPVDNYNRPLTISTFRWSGEPMLTYARLHPEIKWLFKPHPRLRGDLIELLGWSVEKTDSYYAAWEKIGVACYDANYIEWFNRSRAMITDCASFLVEYGVTGKPILHMKLKSDRPQYDPGVERLINTYYSAENVDELNEMLELVVKDKQDPNCATRLSALHDIGLKPGGAADRIINYLMAVCGRRR